MTVRELIDHLSTFPPDALIIYRLHSDYEAMDRDEVALIEPKDGEGVIIHHGHVMRLRKGWWDREGAGREPEFVTAVRFPGN